MTTNGPLGECPQCGTVIPQPSLLIKYETDEGWPAMFAECPNCAAVVHPTSRYDNSRKTPSP